RLAHAAFHHLVEAHESAAADEEHVRGVDLDEFLVRMLAPALGRHIGHRAFEDLQERLLDSLARDVTRDGGILALAGDLVDLVDVHDAALGPVHVVVGGLKESENDVLHVLPDITGLGEGGRVGDGEGHVEHLGQGLREKGLAGPGRTDEKDIGLLELDVARFATRLDALVVVVDGHGEDLLGPVLPDHVLVEHGLDLGGLGEAANLLTLLLLPLLRDDVVAELDAFVADVHGGARDELADVVLALAAERALQRPSALARPGRHRPAPSRPAAATAGASVTDRVVGLEAMTSSTILYSLACSAVMKKSRSVSRWIFSMLLPVWGIRLRF